VIFPSDVQRKFDAEAKELNQSVGLRKSFAGKVAPLLAYFRAYGLNPRVISGWRDPAKQKAMRDRWDRGDRQGLRARPAMDSLHTRVSQGSPAADGVDITTTNDNLAAKIAMALGVGPGLYFSEPDPGHYYAR